MAVKLSASAHEKLLSIVEKTAIRVGDGESPNTVIEKLAREHQLRSGEIEVLCRAYNVAKTNATREAGKSLTEKAASFELADYSLVNGNIFPETVKVTDVVEKKASSTHPLRDQYAIPTRKPLFEKVAGAPAASTLALSDYPRDPQMVAARLNAKAEKLARLIHDQTLEVPARTAEKIAALRKLEAAFRPLEAPNFSAVKEAAAIMDPDFEAVLEAVEALSPGVTKRAYESDWVELNHPVFDLIDNVAKAVVSEKQATEKVANFAGGIALLRMKFDDSTLVTEIEKTAAGVSELLSLGALHGHLSSALQNTRDRYSEMSADDIINNNVNRIGSPGHEAKLKRIALEARLQDLAANDAVLAGRRPQELAGAFNELAQFAPEHTSKDIPLRMAMRRQFAQEGLEPFSQDQMLDIEKSLRDQTPTSIL